MTPSSPDPLVTAIETALSDIVTWRKPVWMSDTVQSFVAAGEYHKAAEVMAPRIRSLVDVPASLSTSGVERLARAMHETHVDCIGSGHASTASFDVAFVRRFHMGRATSLAARLLVVR